MKKNNQQMTQNLSCPMKTKVAAWWIIILGIIFFGQTISTLYSSYSISKDYDDLYLNSFLIFAIFPAIFNILVFLLPGIFLIKRKKIAWGFTIGIFLIIFIRIFLKLGMDVFYQGFDLNFPNKLVILFYVSMIVPFVLLILDRKNFFKVAS